MIRAVICDLGKVILRFDNGIFFKKVADLCGKPEEKIREVAHQNSELIELFDTGKIRPEEFHKRIMTALQTDLNVEEFFSAYCDVFFLNAPVLETLKKLKSRYKLILLSNTDPIRFGFIKNKFPEVFIFDHYVLSCEVGFLKPQPEIYQMAMQKAAAAPSECVFIDDMATNLDGASALGIPVLLYKLNTDLEKGLGELGVSL